ncbi:MAG: YbbR-like domain-containing protein [Cyclobacteriaceae bacterium]
MSTLGKYFRKLRPERTSNLKVVVLCVITAATFWLLNALNKDNYNTVVNQPIYLSYDEVEYMAVEEVPNSIKIEVQGNGWDLLKRHLQIGVTPFIIQLEEPGTPPYLPAETFRSQLREHLSATQLVTVVEDTLHYKIDKVVSKKVEVLLDTTENVLAENHEFGPDININPPEVTVTGPISIIEEMEGKLFVSIGQKNISENFSKLLLLELDREKEKFLTLEEETVQVDFEVIAYLEGNKRLGLSKIYFPANVDIGVTDTTVMIFYLVDERRLDDFNEMELKAVLNYNNRDREDSTISVSLNPNPNYLKEITFNPEKYKLIYE